MSAVDRDTLITAIAKRLHEDSFQGRVQSNVAFYDDQWADLAGFVLDAATGLGYRVIGPEEQAVLDAAAAWADAPDAYVKAIYGGDLYDAVLAARGVSGE